MSGLRKKVPLFVIIGILFGLKTYIIYRFIFQIEIENILQELIIFINPFVTSIIFFGMSIWIKKRPRSIKFIFYGAIFGSIIIYLNLLFYRSFTDFITIPQLFQTSNLSDLTTSVFSLIRWYDPLLLLDIVISYYLCKAALAEDNFQPYPKKKKILITIIFFLMLSGNFLLAELERPQLLSRAFDREYLVKNIGLFYYHVYDAYVQSKMRAQKALADESDLKEIKQFMQAEMKEEERSELFAIAKQKNIIFISAESLQTFVIENTLHGEEVTPFLNSLIRDKDTFYFDNFYHQTAQGKTSDSEFIVENGLYPLSGGAVFFTHGQNDYYAFPEIIQPFGYGSVVFHANTDTFWNRNQMYESLQIDHFYDSESYELTGENQVGWGLKDKVFFAQSMPYLEALPKPFYAKFITLTNHFPFDLDEEDRSLEPYDSNSTTLNKYFSTVRYMDEAIEQFFLQLKASGLYEESIIVIMGDHDGISANHNKAMALYLNKETITPFDYMQLQRVPFYIHIPGYGEGKRMATISGQIDVKPTLLHLLGIEAKEDIMFGNDLFSENRKPYIAQRNGSFISDQFIFTNEICYDRQTAVVLATESEAEEEGNPCYETKQKVEQELMYSDDLIYGDLLRFTPMKE